MTLISLLVNKFLHLINSDAVAVVESSSITMFGSIAIILIAAGLLTIYRKRPVLVKYSEYTPESVSDAATLLGVSDIVLGVLDIVIGVVRLDWIPMPAVCTAAVVGLAVFIAIQTKAYKKLVKL